MMKRLLCILFAAALCFSCTRLENEEPQPAPAQEATGKVRVRFSVSLPELTPSTKALSDTPSGDLTSLHIAVFGSSGYLKEYVQATMVDTPTANGHYGGNDNRYEFTADLTMSENSKRRIHILGNGPEILNYDQETTLIPALLSPAGHGAYWQSFIVPGIKAKRDADGNLIGVDTITVNGETVSTGTGTFQIADETQAYFDDIPLIRNFAKIVVEDVAGSNFVTKSFAAVNVPTQGSFAPYYSGGFVYNYETHTYTSLHDELKYPALLPLNTEFDSTVPSKADFISPSSATATVPASSSFFLYERPVPNEDQDPTVVVIYGTYTDPDLDDGVDSSGDYFYKVDLMENKDYYPIYRNFKYRIQIKQILKPGADTPADALVSMGSGDVSADISTQTLTDISDGESRILVTYMAKTLIRQYPYIENGQTEQMILKYKFIPDVDDTSGSGGEPAHNNDLVANGGPISISLQSESDPVILSYSVASSDDTEGYRTITINTDAPKSNVRTQYLRVTGTVTRMEEGVPVEYSLYRNVTYTMLSKQTMTVSCNPSKVTKTVGEQMEVDITIPKNLPSSMFPLIFNIESSALSLTPDNSRTEAILQDNNLPVASGTSIIDGNNSTTFHFVRTLSEDDYKKLSRASSTNTVTLPCFFKTNKAESACEVWVSNDYFNSDYDSFGNYKLKYFTNLDFTNGVPKTAGTTAPFTFHMDESDPLPQKVYFQFTGVRPTGTSGLALISDSSDPHNGWYWYSPTSTGNASLLDNYTPIINLATTGSSGTATVVIEADEYHTASYEYPNIVTKNFDINNSTLSNGNNKSVTDSPVTITFSNIYTTAGTYVRPGRNATITVNVGSGRTIKEVVINFTSAYYTYDYTVSTGSKVLNGSTWTWTGSAATSLVISNGYDRNSRISSIYVTYEE